LVERDVLLKLDHPNVIKLSDFFTDSEKLYFVLEYVGGGEFGDYLRKKKTLPKEQSTFHAAEIVSILEYLHGVGLAHRDLKPENLMITAEGHLKAIDFGTAKLIHSEHSMSELYKKGGIGKGMIGEEN
jgi:3-phosphoinositide dependent protein kinase-1